MTVTMAASTETKPKPKAKTKAKAKPEAKPEAKPKKTHKAALLATSEFNPGHTYRQSHCEEPPTVSPDVAYRHYLAIVEYLTRTLPRAMQPRAAALVPLSQRRADIDAAYLSEFGILPPAQAKRKPGTVTPICSTFPTVRHKMPASARQRKATDSTGFYMLVRAGILLYLEPIKAGFRGRGCATGGYTIAPAYANRLLTRAEVSDIITATSAPRTRGTMTVYKVDPRLLSDEFGQGSIAASPQLQDFALGEIEEVVLV
jgi:hypothetical protein